MEESLLSDWRSGCLCASSFPKNQVALHCLTVVATGSCNTSLWVPWLIYSHLDTFSFKLSNFTLIYLTSVCIERMRLLRRYQQTLLVPVSVLPGHCGFLRVQQHAALIPFVWTWAESASSSSRGVASLTGDNRDTEVWECLGSPEQWCEPFPSIDSVSTLWEAQATALSPCQWDSWWWWGSR